MQHIHVNGTDLPYRDDGVGQPIVMVHGNGPDMDTLRGVATDLARDHRVITYNRRGYWQAGPPASSWPQHRDDLAAMLDQLGIRGAAVVGFSGGGIVALDLAVERPDLVGALVLHEPPIHGRRHVTPSLVWTVLKVKVLGRRSEERAMTSFLRWVMSRRDGTSVWDRPDYTDERRQLSLRNAAGALADIDNGDGSHIPVDRLRAISCPVTLLLGEQSQRWFHKIAETLTDVLPTAEVIELPDVGHAMAYENPGATADAIRTGVRVLPETREPTA